MSRDMTVGYIKLHRQIQENGLWRKRPFSHGQAWIDLLLSASWKETSFWKRGIEVKQTRGQVALSIKSLATRWGWTPNKVKRFLKRLKNEHQIEHQSDNVTTIITILNWDKYQLDEHKNEYPNGHQTDTRIEKNEHNQEGIKKVEEGTRKENPPNPPSETGGTDPRTSGADGEGRRPGKRKPEQASDAELVASLNLDPPFNDANCQKALAEWLSYKRARREAYKQPDVQLRKMVAQFMSVSALVAAIDKAMANNWKGCVFQDTPRGDSESSPRQFFDDLRKWAQEQEDEADRI